MGPQPGVPINGEFGVADLMSQAGVWGGCGQRSPGRLRCPERWKPSAHFSSESWLGKLLIEVKRRSAFYPCADLFQDIHFVLTLDSISLLLMFGLKELLLLTAYLLST